MMVQLGRKLHTDTSLYMTFSPLMTLKILSLVIQIDVSKWWIIFFQSWSVVLTLESEGVYLASSEQSGSHIY